MTARALDAARALRDFLRGFLGLPGTPGAASGHGDSASARRALEERAARRRSCC
jgi:hypothetical protein